MAIRDLTHTHAMQEFVFLRGWFDRYCNTLDDQAYLLNSIANWLMRVSSRFTSGSLGERYYTFKMALNWYLQHGGERIVETGSLREPRNWFGVGCSTYLFGEVASTYGGHLWSCDIDERAIETAQREASEFLDWITFVCNDSVQFLQAFDKGIDLLYLDSMDCPRRGDASYAQIHNLRELESAFPKLSEHAIVLLDDNRFQNGGKTRLSKRFLSEQGWLCLFDWHQSVWTKPRS